MVIWVYVNIFHLKLDNPFETCGTTELTSQKFFKQVLCYRHVYLLTAVEFQHFKETDF